ncbi:MAG: lipoprotein [Paludibacteraceae bacterium]|jgi:hypothetical protein|nr:lipoprotein [Paludibacteraceae bacterium]MBO7454950.1 lipoprotein [Paludibacteraceae bacterium]
MKRLAFIALGFVALLTGCNGNTTFRSSVPAYPVHLEINTNVGMYVNFVPENVTTYLIADKNGIHLNGVTQPLTVQDAYGYAGTVVYIDGFHPYGAYDLCCPHCLLRDKPCTVDGIFAICPVCGEEYDIYSGNGVPTHGISTEPLRQHMTTYNPGSGKLLVSPKQ